MNRATTQDGEPSLPLVASTLIKSVVYRDENPRVWRQLAKLDRQVRDYFATVGLMLILDEEEGYAFLRQRPDEQIDPAAPSIPRLVSRQPYSMSRSLLLALLRKRLAEQDARDLAGSKLVLTEEQMLDMVRTFLPQTSDEVLADNRIRDDIGALAGSGFLRKFPDQPKTYEVRRILKAFVDAEQLARFLQRIQTNLAPGDSTGDTAGNVKGETKVEAEHESVRDTEHEPIVAMEATRVGEQ